MEIANVNQIVVPSLNDFLNNVKDFSKNRPNVENYVKLSVQFVTRMIDEFEKGGDPTRKQNSKNDFRSGTATNHKWSVFNKELQKYERIERDVRTKIDRKNQIGHHFDVVERQLQLAMKNKIIKSDAVIVAAAKEHEHKMSSLELDANNLQSTVESYTKKNESEKKYRLLIRNDLKTRKTQIIHSYDTEMAAKYKTVKEFNIKIKMIEDGINQLQESILLQMPSYKEVIAEKEAEYERIWNEKLHTIQRKIAARKIQIHFREYLNYIKTRETKKNKKTSRKKPILK